METLNYIEAHLALAEGKCVQINGQRVYRWNAEIPRCEGWYPEENEWVHQSPADAGIFRIVPDPSLPAIPEPKSLSFDEAVAAYLAKTPLRVQKPDGTHCADIDWRDPRFAGFDLHVISYLDLAERRGWPIHPIDKEGWIMEFTHEYSATVTFTVNVRGKLLEGFSESMIPSLAIENAADALMAGDAVEEVEDIECWPIEKEGKQ